MMFLAGRPLTSSDAATQTPIGTLCQTLTLTSRDRCFSAAVVRITVGCVHEHITTGPSCAVHAADAKLADLHCLRCWQVDQHACPVIVGREESIS